MRIKLRRYFDGSEFITDKVLTIADGIIQQQDDGLDNYDIEINNLVVPGFIDLQVNGGGGVLFNVSPSLNGIQTMINAHSRFGTTALLPTVITDTNEVMQQAADAIAQAIAEGIDGVIGVHFEGPNLSVAKKGAHSAEFIRRLTANEQTIYCRQDLGQVLVTLSPDNVAPEQVRKLRESGVHICIGHTNASFEQCLQAINAGATGFTHLYNAMSPLTGREPGAVGACFLHDETYAGVILDGHHVDYNSVKIAQKAKPANKIFFVTDSMSTIATEQTEFAFFDRTVTLKDGKLTSTTGELAGSALDMNTALKNAVNHLQLPLAQALKMVSRIPAEYIGLGEQLGQLKTGYQADFTVLDEQLNVQQTYIKGQQKWSN